MSVTIKYDIYLVCRQSLLNCDTVSVKQKCTLEDTLENASKIYNDTKERDRDFSISCHMPHRIHPKKKYK